MPDMLVKLYTLPDLHAPIEKIERLDIRVRRPNPWEKPVLLDWVRVNFSRTWADESEVAFTVNPPSCFMAIAKDVLIGFACYDCTRKNFFGPTGVAENAQGKGVGVALLLSCLHVMQDNGFAYAIIGGVGPAEYYSKIVGATLIEGTVPGIYDFALRRKEDAS